MKLTKFLLLLVTVGVLLACGDNAVRQNQSNTTAELTRLNSVANDKIAAHCQGVGMVSQSARQLWLAQPTSAKNVRLAQAQALRSTLLDDRYPTPVTPQTMQAMSQVQATLSYLIETPISITPTTVFLAAQTQCLAVALGIDGQSVATINVSAATNTLTYLQKIRACQLLAASEQTSCHLQVIERYAIYR